MCENQKKCRWLCLTIKLFIVLFIFGAVLLLLSAWYYVRRIDVSFQYASPEKFHITIGHDCDNDLFTKEKMVLRTFELPAQSHPKQVILSIPAVSRTVSGIYMQFDKVPVNLMMKDLCFGDKKKIHFLDFIANNLLPQPDLKYFKGTVTVTKEGTLRMPLTTVKKVVIRNRILYANLVYALLIAAAAGIAFFYYCKTHFTKEHILLLLFILPGLFLLIMPLIRLDFYGKTNKENRFLHTFPSLLTRNKFNREFPREFEKFLNDRFFPRTQLIEWDREVFSLNFFNSGNEKIAKMDTKTALWGKEMWMFSTHFNSIKMIQNKNLFTEDELKLCAKRLTDLEKKFREKFNAKMYVLLLPDKERIYEEYYPDHLLKQREGKLSRLEQLRNHLKEHTKVNVLCPMEQLLAAKKQHIVYFRTGTHHTYRGAEISAKLLLENFCRDFPKLKGLQKYNPVMWALMKNADIDVAYQLGFTDPYKQLPDVAFKNEVPIFKIFADSARIQYAPALSLFIYSHKAPPEHAKKGVRALVISDSFWSYILPFLVPTLSEQYHLFYGSGKNFVIDSFDEEIAKFKPEIVIIESVERFLDRFLYIK